MRVLIVNFSIDPISGGGTAQRLRDRALREALVARGLENVRRFDPAGIARTFVEIYRALAGA